MVRVPPSPYRRGLPIRDSIGLGGLRIKALSPILGGELETEGMEAGEGGSSLTTGLEGSGVNETTAPPPGFELLLLGVEHSPPADPKPSIVGSPVCSPSGISCKLNQHQHLT